MGAAPGEQNNHGVACTSLNGAELLHCEISKNSGRKQVRKTYRPVWEAEGYFHRKTTAHLK